MSMSQYRGRHRRSSRSKPTIAATVSTAFVLGGFAGATPAEAATASDFARLRQCESGGNYRINTGNGYYGAYQFDLSTWRGIGFSGYPHQASPATQDAAARRLQSMRGWSPWPACSRMLGLRSGSRTTASAPAPAQRTRTVTAPARQQAVRVRAVQQVQPVRQQPERPKVPVLKVGTVLTAPKAPEDAFVMQTTGAPRADVKRWQLQMARRGWDIEVDGYYGAESARVARTFAAEKRLDRATAVLAAQLKALAERRAEGEALSTAEKKLTAVLDRLEVTESELADKGFSQTFVIWQATWERPVT
ncbi:MAG TPA: transglycosylase family protein [Mycobacteriales bacterium]|nr:transglycosylase family protein [Mycobacteriales bacterium]